jgi:RNA polymerase sigma factor FliA
MSLGFSDSSIANSLSLNNSCQLSDTRIIPSANESLKATGLDEIAQQPNESQPDKHSQVLLAQKDWLDGKCHSSVVLDFLLSRQNFADKIADKLSEMIPKYVTVTGPEDLRQEAQMALFEALEKFDPAKGASFETYASYIISGRLRDHLRNMDHFTRAMRDKELQVKSDLDKKSIDPEHSITVEHFWGELPKVVPLKEGPTENDEGNHNLNTNSESPPNYQTNRLDFWREAFKGCSTRERLALYLCFSEDLTTKQIGAHIGLKGTAVSNLIRSCLKKMTHTFKEHPEKRELLFEMLSEIKSDDHIKRHVLMAG